MNYMLKIHRAFRAQRSKVLILKLIKCMTKHLFTETSGKQCVLRPLHHRRCPWLRLGKQTAVSGSTKHTVSLGRSK
jgi:hypothetical protein